MQPGHIKTYIAPTAVDGMRVVKAGAANGQVAVAANASAPLLGITERIGTRDNDRVDVILSGIALAVAGGNISRGAAVTAGTGGAVVASTTDGDWIIGFADEDAASGDHVPVRIAPGSLSVPA
jgi:hypothetical protein